VFQQQLGFFLNLQIAHQISTTSTYFSFMSDPSRKTDAQYFNPVPNGKPLFEVTAVNFTAAWGWNSTTETCAICHESLVFPCMHCNVSNNIVSNGSCPISWSQCLHGFHTHCIQKWSATSNTCPLCQADWVEFNIQGD
jgi:hypothetical protein